MNNLYGIRKRLAAVIIVSGVLGASTALAWYPGYSYDQQVRKEYNAKISEAHEDMRPEIIAVHNQSQSIAESMAREAVDIRNKHKKHHDSITSWIGRKILAVTGRNKLHTYEEYIAEGYTSEEILYKAFKTGGADLGLKNNGFGDIVGVWNILRSAGYENIYPENINAAKVAQLKVPGAKTMDKAIVLKAYADDPQSFYNTSSLEEPLLDERPRLEEKEESRLDERPRLEEKEASRLMEIAVLDAQTQVRVSSIDTQLARQAEQMTGHGRAIDKTNARLDMIESRAEAIEQRADKIKKDMQQLDRKAMRGIAAVAAMGNAEQPSVPGNMVATAGVGNYGGRQAVAVNINYRPEKSEPVNIHAGAGASSGGRPVMRMGVSYEF